MADTLTNISVSPISLTIPNNDSASIVADGWKSTKTLATTAFDRTMNLLDQMTAQIRAGIDGIGAVTSSNVSDPAFLGVQGAQARTARELLAPGAMSAVLPKDPAAIDFPDVEYLGPLIDEVLVEFLDGGAGGLPDGLEEAQWARSRERIDRAASAAVQSAQYRFSSRGWDIPAGDLARMERVAKAQAVDAQADESRNVEREQFTRRIQARQFGVTAAHERQLSILRQTAESAVSLHAAVVQSYEAALKKFLADVQWVTEYNRVVVDSDKAYNDYVAEIYKGNAAVYEADVRLVIGRMDHVMQTASQNLQLLARKLESTQQYYGTASQVTAGLTSAIYSSVNLAAGISDSLSQSFSNSQTNTFSAATSVSTNNSSVDSTSTSHSTSDSNVTVTNR